MQTPAHILTHIRRVREARAADPDAHPFAHQLRIETGETWRLSGEVASIATGP